MSVTIKSHSNTQSHKQINQKIRLNVTEIENLMAKETPKRNNSSCYRRAVFLDITTKYDYFSCSSKVTEPLKGVMINYCSTDGVTTSKVVFFFSNEIEHKVLEK